MILSPPSAYLLCLWLSAAASFGIGTHRARSGVVLIILLHYNAPHHLQSRSRNSIDREQYQALRVDFMLLDDGLRGR